jgi:farnesyl diphosphate synthase
VTDIAGGTPAAGGEHPGGARLVSGPGEPPSRGATFADQVSSWQSLIEQALAKRLPAADSEPTRLHAAMRDSVLHGGDRARPLLLFCAARAVGLGEAQVEAAACAIELMHAYSRVHDHLPAMDDEDLRRGRPTCHQAYDEGTAVLVGDALQSLAFQLLAGDEALPRLPRIRLRLIELLADAIGAGGKAGAQSLEAAMQGRQLPAADIEALYARKTGALIRASVLMAVACAPDTPSHLQAALGEFASSAGVAFQIQDDLLDLSGGGKRAQGKLTYPAAVGPAEAQRRVEALYAHALEALRPFGPAADALRSLTGWLLMRN